MSACAKTEHKKELKKKLIYSVIFENDGEESSNMTEIFALIEEKINTAERQGKRVKLCICFVDDVILKIYPFCV
ncbi:MAG: hypothetical protein AAB352_00755 [Patescibacteria group bacterium]